MKGFLLFLGMTIVSFLWYFLFLLFINAVSVNEIQQITKEERFYVVLASLVTGLFFLFFDFSSNEEKENLK